MPKKAAKQSVKAMPKSKAKKNGPIKHIAADAHLGSASKGSMKEPKHEAFDHHTTPSKTPNKAMPAAKGSVKAYRKKK